MKKENKVSPYRLFKDWLLNPYPDAVLSEDVCRAINPKTVLHMFGKLGDITVYLDQYFNNFGLMECDPMEFYKFVKDIVQKYSIKKYDFSFFATISRDDVAKKLHKKLPYLKEYEIYSLLEYCSNDSDNDSFLENLGLKKVTKKKVKKSKISKKKIKNKSDTFDSIINDIATWDEWKKNFNISGEIKNGQ